MKDTALYEQLLGLKEPWPVKKVDLSLADQRVVVKIILKKGQRHRLVGAGHLMKGLPQGADLAHQRHARGMVPGGLTAVGGMGGQVHALCGANGAVGISAQLKAFTPHAAAVVVGLRGESGCRHHPCCWHRVALRLGQAYMPVLS